MSKGIVIGADSGLGKAVVKSLEEKGWNVISFYDSPQLSRQVDLTDEAVVKSYFSSTPDVLFYCSQIAEEDLEKDFEHLNQLNIKTIETLAKICNENGCWFLLVSSSSVFDGYIEEQQSVPYSTNFEPKPMSKVGKFYADAESTLWENQSDAGVLRVSSLYGADSNNEIVKIAQNVVRGRGLALDDNRIIYPTYAEDVALVCVALAERKIQRCGLYGTWHWSGSEGFTRYKLAQAIAAHFHKSCQITALQEGNASNIQLNCIALEMMGMGNEKTPFLQGIQNVLQSQGFFIE